MLNKLEQLLAQSQVSEAGVVNIMSVHRSKGLQAANVFILGLVEGIIPNKSEGLAVTESQRRVMFVGMTRATQKLYCLSTVEWDGAVIHRVDASQFTFDRRRKKHMGPASSFIAEMKSKPTA
jgi:superfamily I DNA/RNA helicase